VLPLEAYIAAHYRVDAPHGSFTIRVGDTLAVDVARHACGTPWAILTAWNPGSLPTEAATNARAAAELAVLLDALGVQRWPALNHDGHGDHAEPAQFVAGLGVDAADRLAARFGQFALVAGVIDGPARLRVLAPRTAPPGVDTRFVDWVASGTPSTAGP
jgi:hypothetical protein